MLRINKDLKFPEGNTVQDLKIDILSRLPYNLRIVHNDTIYNADTYDAGQIVLRGRADVFRVSVKFVKPLLRRMNSMTEKEKIEYETLLADATVDGEVWKVTDWLNRNMFDYRGLIDDNLAVEM